MHSHLLKMAQEEISASGEGVLSLGLRGQIWRELALLSDPPEAYRRRVALNAMTVRNVIALWEEAWPNDSGVEEMLFLAQAVVDGQIAAEEAEAQRDSFWVDAVDERDYGENSAALFVAAAAANTVTEALIVDNAAAIPSVDDDEALDPDAYDTSYLAASARAGALNGRPANIEARREFWRWYIDVAIPEVYSL